MPFTKRRFWFRSVVFFVALCVMCCAFYRFVKGPTIRADQVRVFRLLESGKAAARPIVQLQGEAAQKAAYNFDYSTGGPYYECMDTGGWFEIVFTYQHKDQVFDVYLHNGQMEPGGKDVSGTTHLSKSSLRYWQQLVGISR